MKQLLQPPTEPPKPSRSAQKLQHQAEVPEAGAGNPQCSSALHSRKYLTADHATPIIYTHCSPTLPGLPHATVRPHSRESPWQQAFTAPAARHPHIPYTDKCTMLRFCSVKQQGKTQGAGKPPMQQDSSQHAPCRGENTTHTTPQHTTQLKELAKASDRSRLCSEAAESGTEAQKTGAGNPQCSRTPHSSNSTHHLSCNTQTMMDNTQQCRTGTRQEPRPHRAVLRSCIDQHKPEDRGRKPPVQQESSQHNPCATTRAGLNPQHVSCEMASAMVGQDK